MSEQVDIESDPFLTLLTDALRAGPGSPQWHEAIKRLRSDGMEGSEHAMLIAVREHLESGKEYRTVRAGPGFTRKLMDRIDEESQGRRRAFPLSVIIAFAGVLAIIGLIGATVIIFRPRPQDRMATELAQLRSGQYTQTVTQASFDGAPLTGWTTTGPVQLNSADGLKPAATQPSTSYRAAAIESAPVILSTDQAAIEALVVPPTDPTTIVQIYVRTTNDEPGQEKEAAWVLQAGKSRVALPGGRFIDGSQPFVPGKGGAMVRMSIGAHMMVIVADGREIYAGPSGLPLGDPRRLGIRFLTKGGRATDGAVLSARVVKP